MIEPGCTCTYCVQQRAANTAALATSAQAAVVATLRYSAALVFGVSEDRAADLYAAADQVAKADLTDSWCCPLCEETDCDDDCALRPYRTT